MATPLYIQCRLCSTINPADEVFCRHCGATIRPMFGGASPGFWLVVALLVVILVWTNPNEDAFADWITGQVVTQSAVPSNGWEMAGQAIGISLGRAMIRSLIVRQNFLLFSIYRGGRPGSQGVIIGAAGQFFRLGGPDH